MVSIYVDGKLFYTESIIEKDFAIISPKCTIELGDAPSFEMTIPPNHPMYSQISKLKSDIEVRIRDNVIFFGRAVSDDSDFYRRKQLYCEGALAFLQNGTIPPYSFKECTVETYIRYIISNYNRTLGESEATRRTSGRYFNVGTILGVDSKTSDYSNSSYSKPMDNLESVISNYGGYFTVEKSGNEYTLNYATEELFQANAIDSKQQITFGVNLLDLSQHIDASEVCTVLFPYGDKIDTGSSEEVTQYVTLGSTGTGGTDYLVASEQMLNLFGRVTKPVQFQGCTTAAALKEQALKYLEKSTTEAIEITINAVDLALLGSNPQLISVGSKVHVTSIPHGIYNQTFICSRIEYDLAEWSNTTYTFGPTQTTLTTLQNSNKNSALAIIERAKDIDAKVSGLDSDVVNIAREQETFSITVNEALEAIDVRLKTLEEAII